MKKVFVAFALTAMAVNLVSCGGKKESEENVENAESEELVLTPETTRIKGDLSDYFEVVEREYTPTNEWGTLVSVEVRRTDKEYAFSLDGVEPYGTYGSGVKGHAGFGIEILDAKGNVIDKSAANAGGLSGMYSSDDMKEALKLKPGETATVRWSFRFDDKTPVKFRLSSAYEECSDRGSDNDSDDSDDDSADVSSYSSSGSEDWDDLLSSYEKYVDKYISYVKKAANGDMDALSEYPALMEQAQEFSEKMSNAQSDMSAAQWSRYMKITNKMNKAAQQML